MHKVLVTNVKINYKAKCKDVKLKEVQTKIVKTKTAASKRLGKIKAEMTKV